MSMTVYPITGAALSFNATDIKSATGLVRPEESGLPEDARGGVVVINQDREVTKAGATRIMVKASFKTPVRDTGQSPNADAVTMGEVSAHCVLTVPKNVANTLVLESTAGTGDLDGSATSAVVWVLAVLTAVLNNKSLATLPARTFMQHPMLQGIVGKLPLNVESGTYGSAS